MTHAVRALVDRFDERHALRPAVRVLGVLAAFAGVLTALVAALCAVAAAAERVAP